MTDADLITQARERAKIDQFDLTKFDPGQTKLGPCHWFDGRWTSSSWYPSYPIFPEYVRTFEVMGNKYHNLDWLPLDIPRIELNDLEEFQSLWEQNSAEITSLVDPTYVPEWRGVHIHCFGVLDFSLHDVYDIHGKLTIKLSDLDRDLSPQERPVVGTMSRKLFKHRFFNDIIAQVMDHYPIHTLSNILILEPIRDVAPHREQSWPWRCPTEFRTMLHDANTQPTIYISDIETGSTSYIDLPDDTNTFCWSNGTKVYGVDYHGKPSYQLVVNAIWDSNKMTTLLERSLSKHKSRGL
jgi:hypothetical protein